MAKPAPTPKPLTLTGTKGSDALTGGALGDLLNALGGTDTLIGKGGADTLTGGAEGDTFMYLQLNDSIAATGIDTIRDFNANAGDKVDLTALGTATFKATYDATFTGLQAVFAYNAATNRTMLSYFQGSSAPVFQLQFNGNVTYSETAFLGIVSVPPNRPPALTGTAATLAAGTEDTAYIVSASALLAGWTDADANSLSVNDLVADHGSVVANSDGTYSITPTANYNGPVSLSYKVSDGTASTNASLGFSLAAANDPPALTGTAATLAAGTEDTAYIVSAADLLTGWADADGNSLSVTDLVADHGSVVANSNGTYSITPTANYNGPVSLS